MNKYIGMTFMDWCMLDENDETPINYTYIEKGEEFKFTSNQTIEEIKKVTNRNGYVLEHITMMMIRLSKIRDIKKINNEWYITIERI